jgi:hypothetical protein
MKNTQLFTILTTVANNPFAIPLILVPTLIFVLGVIATSLDDFFIYFLLTHFRLSFTIAASSINRPGYRIMVAAATSAVS